MPASIFVFADLHLGHPDSPGLRWALQELEAAANSGATACVCLGDIIDRNANSAEFVPQVHTVMAHAVTLFSEVHFISGNHDTHHDLDFPPEVTLHSTQVHTFQIGETTVLSAAAATDPDLAPPPAPTAPQRRTLSWPPALLRHRRVFPRRLPTTFCRPATGLRGRCLDPWARPHPAHACRRPLHRLGRHGPRLTLPPRYVPRHTFA